jgi:long-subunit fatty acid transport protein
MNFRILLASSFAIFALSAAAQDRGYRGFIDITYNKEVTFYEEYSGDNKKDLNKIEMTYSNGYQFNKHFYLGAGIGFSFPTDRDNTFIPVFIDTRFYLDGSKFTPYFSLRGGYEMCKSGNYLFSASKTYSYKDNPFINPSFGVRYRFHKKLAVNANIGYQFKKEPEYIESLQYGGTSYYTSKTHKIHNYNAINARVGFEF